MEESRLATDLGGDIWHIINNLLLQESQNSLLALRLASRSNKVYADPVLYRCLKLSDEDKMFKSTEHNIERLLDPSDDLSLHVRDLVVSNTRRAYTNFGKLKKISDDFRPGDLEKVIENLHHLQSFSWNIKRPTPEAIIAKLEQRWPDVILSVDAHNHPITDKRSLYSPLLHSLSFCILNHTATVTATSQLEQYSKLPELREVLLRSPNLRKLDIKFEYNWMSRQVEWSGITASPHVLNMPLEPSDRLPPLQELTFSGPPETYEFTLEHCQLWKQCMDWSRLRRLDLGISCPQHFFEHFGNSLTSLKSLAMGVRFGDRHYTHWAQGPLTCDGLLAVENFIRCIPHLHELNITDFSSAFADTFHLIGTRHRTLRKLYYHASINRTQRQHGNPDVVYRCMAREITKLPELRDLTIDFLLLDGRWPIDHAKHIATFSRLNTLRIFVELNSEVSDFAKEYLVDPEEGGHMPPFNVEPAKKVTTDLFKSFFAHNPYSCLTSLEVCFLRHRREDRVQRFEMKSSIRIKRLERDDAPSPLDGGFVVDADGEWLHCDLRTQQTI